VKGIISDKSRYLERLLKEHKIDVVLLQKTHISGELQMIRRASIFGYTLISAIYHRSYGSAIYVRNNIKNWSNFFSTSTNTEYIIAIYVAEVTILNIYKPPNEIWSTSPLPVMQHQSIYIYIGDFNSHQLGILYE
jgi:exonuclease III